MRKPYIAVTADTLMDYLPAVNTRFAPFSSRELMEVISRLGAIPVILPDVSDISGEDYMDCIDGLILPGGLNVDPTLYGEEPIMSLGATHYKRDIFEIKIFQSAQTAGKPILGICRGMQLINIAMGGSLWQNIETQKDSGAKLGHLQAAPGGWPVHHVKIKEKSFLFPLMGASTYVNSRHKQAIKKLAPGLKIIAAAYDGIAEALQSAGEVPLITAVQWHPENMWREHDQMYRLFEDYLSRVRLYMR